MIDGRRYMLHVDSKWHWLCSRNHHCLGKIEMHNARLKTADEMRSAIDTVRAELGNLNDWDNAALDNLWGWMSAHLVTIEIEMNKRKG